MISEKYEQSIRIKKIATKEDAEYLGCEIGAEYSQLPDIKNKDELFERFEKLHAQRVFESMQRRFNKKYGNPTEKIIKDELAEINSFVEKANQLSTTETFKNQNHSELHEYSRLVNGYYKNETKPFFPCVFTFFNSKAVEVYAKYFHYKHWLESQLGNSNRSKNEEQRSSEIFGIELKEAINICHDKPREVVKNAWNVANEVEGKPKNYDDMEILENKIEKELNVMNHFNKFAHKGLPIYFYESKEIDHEKTSNVNITLPSIKTLEKFYKKMHAAHIETDFTFDFFEFHKNKIESGFLESGFLDVLYLDGITAIEVLKVRCLKALKMFEQLPPQTIEKPESENCNFQFENNFDEVEKEKVFKHFGLSDLITHENSFEIVKAIKVQYKNIGGKRLNLLLMALQELNLLPKERFAKKFHECCKKEFDWEIKSYNAMNGSKYNEITDFNEKEAMKNFIQEYIQ